MQARLELLAPAGDRECLRAAVSAGADAVYFGLAAGFNARAKAENVAYEELGDTLDYLHAAGVRGYVTLNTLVKDSELEQLCGLIIEVAQARADAVIVQDLGVARLCRQLVPRLPVFASTQMTLADPESAAVAAELGISRIILPRELSIEEIRSYHQASSLELEAFVHGALCISYSGQCLASAAWGRRSANRGLCAQPCRMAYGLCVDERRVDKAGERYLLAPKDLAAFQLVGDLARAGVTSFKIEGRYKGPEYVAATVEKYRRVLDAVEEGRLAGAVLSRDDVEDLAFTFTRGFCCGWLNGADHRTLSHGLYPSHRGLRVGVVESVRGFSVYVRPDENAPEVRAGDWMVFGQGDPEGEEPKGGVFSVGPQRQGLWEIRFGNPGPDLALVRRGDELWKSHDSAVKRRLLRIAATPRKLPITLMVSGRVGAPLVVQARDGLGRTCEVRSEQVLGPASAHGLTPALLRDKLGAFGDSRYRLERLEAGLEGELMVSPAELKRVRRALVEALERQAVPAPRYEIEAGSPAAALPALAPDKPWLDARTKAGSETESTFGSGASSKPRIIPLCRSLDQVEAVLEQEIDELCIDLPELGGARRAVAACRERGARVCLATPRVLKPSDYSHLMHLSGLEPEEMLVRSLGALEWLRRERPWLTLRGDFSLNVANSMSARWLLGRGLASVTLSYDLGAEELGRCAGMVPVGAAEVLLHWRVPLFFTEYCLFAHHLSTGHNQRDCGGPCRKHTLALVDHKGCELRVLADAFCRNTVFNAQAESLRPDAQRLVHAGVRRFRVELVDESRSAARAIVAAASAAVARRSG